MQDFDLDSVMENRSHTPKFIRRFTTPAWMQERGRCSKPKPSRITSLRHTPRQTHGFRYIKTVLCILSLSSAPVSAEEGGSGHYMPGAMASFIDGVPSEPTFVTRLNYLNYKASSDITIPKGSGGLLAEPDATINGLALTVLWAPNWNLGLETKWQFAMSATIPMLNLDLSGNLDFMGTSFGSVEGSRTALGDITLMPLMINYNANKDLNINARLGLYAPTGSYKPGRFINTGKNYWTIEPTIGIIYFGQENGREASVYLGADFNQKNDTTNYRSGTQIHFDGTLAQHFPFLGGVSGVGISGYWYKQITDDSGSGATLGAFRAEASGAGPVLSWLDKTGKHVLEIKYIKDLKNKNRLDGDTFWLKYVVKL